MATNIFIFMVMVNPAAVRCWFRRPYMAGINIGAQAFGPALSGRRHNWRWRKRENEPWFSATPLWGLELGWDATVPSGIVELPFLNMLTRFTTSSALYGRRQNDQTDYNIVYQRTAAGLIMVFCIIRWHHNICYWTALTWYWLGACQPTPVIMAARYHQHHYQYTD